MKNLLVKAERGALSIALIKPMTVLIEEKG